MSADMTPLYSLKCLRDRRVCTVWHVVFQRLRNGSGVPPIESPNTRAVTECPGRSRLLTRPYSGTGYKGVWHGLNSHRTIASTVAPVCVKHRLESMCRMVLIAVCWRTATTLVTWIVHIVHTKLSLSMFWSPLSGWRYNSFQLATVVSFTHRPIDARGK